METRILGYFLLIDGLLLPTDSKPIALQTSVYKVAGLYMHATTLDLLGLLYRMLIVP